MKNPDVCFFDPKSGFWKIRFNGFVSPDEWTMQGEARDALRRLQKSRAALQTVINFKQGEDHKHG